MNEAEISSEPHNLHQGSDDLPNKGDLLNAKGKQEETPDGNKSTSTSNKSSEGKEKRRHKHRRHSRKSKQQQKDTEGEKASKGEGGTPSPWSSSEEKHSSSIQPPRQGERPKPFEKDSYSHPRNAPQGEYQNYKFGFRQRRWNPYNNRPWDGPPRRFGNTQGRQGQGYFGRGPNQNGRGIPQLKWEIMDFLKTCQLDDFAEEAQEEAKKIKEEMQELWVPAHPASAFGHFMKEMKTQEPNFGKMHRDKFFYIALEKWRELEPSEKQVFFKDHEERLEKYKKDMKDLRKEKEKMQNKLRELLGLQPIAKTKYLSAYDYFKKEANKALISSQPEHKERRSTISEIWKGMGKEEKMGYILRAKLLREKCIFEQKAERLERQLECYNRRSGTQNSLNDTVSKLEAGKDEERKEEEVTKGVEGEDVIVLDENEDYTS